MKQAGTALRSAARQRRSSAARPRSSVNVRLNVPRLTKPTSKQIVGHAAIRLPQQEHRPLDAAALQVAVRRLAEGGAEDADEMRLGDVARSAPGSRCRAASRSRDPSRRGRAACDGWTLRRLGSSPRLTRLVPALLVRAPLLAVDPLDRLLALRRARARRAGVASHASSRASFSIPASRSAGRRPSAIAGEHGAARLVAVRAVAEAAAARASSSMSANDAAQARGLLPHARQPQPRRVDHERAARERHQLAVTGRVAAAVVALPHRQRRALLAGQVVEQRRLADARRAEQHRRATGLRARPRAPPCRCRRRR